MSETKSEATKKFKELLKSMKKTTIIILIMAIIIAVLAIILAFRNSQYAELKAIHDKCDDKPAVSDDDEPVITPDIINMHLQAAANLVTAKADYHGFLDFEKGKGLTKKSFTLFYEAEAEAYISLAEMTDRIAVTDTAVYIVLPEVELTPARVVADSLRLFDEKSGIFADTTPEDMIDCLNAAEDHADKIDHTELLTLARTQAEEVIRAMLTNLVDGREILFVSSLPDKDIPAA